MPTAFVANPQRRPNLQRCGGVERNIWRGPTRLCSPDHLRSVLSAAACSSVTSSNFTSAADEPGAFAQKGLGDWSASLWRALTGSVVRAVAWLLAALAIVLTSHPAPPVAMQPAAAHVHRAGYASVTASRPAKQAMFTHKSSIASVTASQPDTADHARKLALYRLQKVFSQNALTKILAVVAVATPLVLVTGYAYSRVTGKELGQSMFATYTVLQDTPGADACCEPTAKAALVLNLTHVIGLFTYALVLGIVSDDVQQCVESFKTGNTAVMEKNHTIVLNSNRTTPNLLRQWAKAQEERGHRAPIVVLSNVPKAELDQLVDDARAETGLDIMGRSGLPYSLDDLDLVNARQASTILIMDPRHHESAESEPQVQPYAATLVSLAALGSDDARFVIQLPEQGLHTAKEHQRDELQSASRLHVANDGRDRVVLVDALRALSDAKVQCTVAPGLSNFYNTVFTHSADSPEVYCAEFEELTGKTFGEARKRFNEAVLMGVHRETTGVHANPPDSFQLREGDTLFALAYDQSCFKTSRSRRAAQGPSDWVRPKHCPDMRARNVVVAAFDEPNPNTLEVLGQSMPRGGTLTVICQDRVSLPRGEFKAKWVKGHPANASVLKSAGIAHADSLLIAGVDAWNDTEADIQVMSTFAQMTDICKALHRSEPLHIVAEARGPLLENFTYKLHDRQSRQQKRVLSSDILPTEEMAAGFMAQCAMQPQLSTITKEVFDIEDARISMCHPMSYMLPDEEVSVGELEDRSRANGEIVVGYLDQELQGHILVSKSAVVKREDVSKLIIMTTDPMR